MATAVAISANFPRPPLSDRIHSICSTPSPHFFGLRSLRSPRRTLRQAARVALASSRSTPPAQQGGGGGGGEREGNAESPYSVLAAMKSLHNDIVVVDTPDSRVLLLDSTHNVHSLLNKEQKWTGSYWDEFASLPAIIPEGPIAILGLGAGTAAHLLLDLWPSLKIEGWEIDEILIDMARDFFGLSILERGMQAGGSLSIHIGDALSPSVAVQGGFAGIIVDLFSDGKIISQLKEDATWMEIEKKLMPHGRIMVNCGGAHAEVSNSSGHTVEANIHLPSSWVQNSTVKALSRVFPGKLSWKKMAKEDSDNYLALTGPLPDLDAWSAALPNPLNCSVKHWIPCELS